LRRFILTFLILLSAVPCASVSGAIGFEAAVVLARQSVPAQVLLAVRERTRNGVWVYECDFANVPPSSLTTATLERETGTLLGVDAVPIHPDDFAVTQQSLQRLRYARTDFAAAIVSAGAESGRTDVERIELLYEAGVLAYRVSYFDDPAMVEIDSITGGAIPALLPGFGNEPTVTVAEMAGAIAHAEWVAGEQWRAIEAAAVQRFDGVTVKVLLANRISGQLMRPEVVQGFLIPSGAFVALGEQVSRAAAVSLASPVVCDAISALGVVQEASPRLGANALSLEPVIGGGYRWYARIVSAGELERDAVVDATADAAAKSARFVEPRDLPIGDLSRDGRVDASDLAILLGAWGVYNPILDVNESGLVDAGDLAAVLSAWTY
jgi:hypothetical protein